MDVMELMKERHSVRQFLDKPLDTEAVTALKSEVDEVNKESGLHIQLLTNEPDAFEGGKPSYGQFKCCKNYLALVGKKGKDEEIGHYGERVVLKAQELGINSCWVALTFKKGKAHYELNANEKLYMVVALGYGETSGNAHKSKSISEISNYKEGDPEWFRNGLEAALLAPTAVNQQKFKFELVGDKVEARAGLGFYARTDLGIVKYHFELGSQKDSRIWK